MTKERTSLPAWKQTHRALKEYKPDEMNWPEFMALVAEDFQDGDVSDMIQENSNASEFDTGELVTEEDVERIVANHLNDLQTELTKQHERMGGR